MTDPMKPTKTRASGGVVIAFFVVVLIVIGPLLVLAYRWALGLL